MLEKIVSQTGTEKIQDDPGNQIFSAGSIDYDEFLAAAKAYLVDGCPEPVVDTNSLHVYFERGLLDKMVHNPPQFKKYMNSLRYGCIGYSKGGRNGIVSINPRTSGRLGKKVIRFIEGIEGKRLLKARNVKSPEPVKVVAHKKNGDRLVGVRDRESGNIFLYGIENYSH